MKIEFTTKEVIEMREFIAFAIRSEHGTKAARKRMVELCEHKLLKAMLKDSGE